MRMYVQASSVTRVVSMRQFFLGCFIFYLIFGALGECKAFLFFAFSLPRYSGCARRHLLR